MYRPRFALFAVLAALLLPLAVHAQDAAPSDPGDWLAQLSALGVAVGAAAIAIGKVLGLLIALCSVVTRMTRFPHLTAAATAIQRVLVALLRFCDWLSVFTHKDSPGTLQAPLVQTSKPPQAIEQPDPPRSAQGGWVHLPLLAALALAAALLAGCPGVTPKAAAATATIATVKTIDAGIAAYSQALQAGMEKRVALRAYEACHDQHDEARDDCVAPYLAPFRATTKAIKVYREALTAAGDGLDHDVLGVALAAVRALAVVGIRVAP
jgi:hypothetical protein